MHTTQPQLTVIKFIFFLKRINKIVMRTRLFIAKIEKQSCAAFHVSEYVASGKSWAYLEKRHPDRAITMESIAKEAEL